MTDLAFLAVGTLLLAVSVACFVEVARRAAFPKCPACGSRKGTTLDEGTNGAFRCEVCGQVWRD